MSVRIGAFVLPYTIQWFVCVTTFKADFYLLAVILEQFAEPFFFWVNVNLGCNQMVILISGNCKP